jgi:hypothetical protein
LIFEKNIERREGFTTATVATNPFIGGRDLRSKLGRRFANPAETCRFTPHKLLSLK